MNCPRCNEATEPGAVFCGNCGQSLQAAMPQDVALPPTSTPAPPAAEAPATTQQMAPDAPDPIPSPTPIPTPAPATTSPGLPSYAVAIAGPVQRSAETKATIGLVVGVLAIPGSLIPFLGMAMATAAIILSTIARGAMPKKAMASLAVVFGCLGLLTSIGAFIYAVQIEAKRISNQTSTKNGVTPSTVTTGSKLLDTPCYSVSMVAPLESIDNAAGSCSAKAFNGKTLDSSHNALAIEAVKQSQANDANFADIAKGFIDSYMADSLPDYIILSRQAGTFAKSKAYAVDAKKKTQNTTIELTIVYHPVANGESLFILAHAVDEGQAKLSDFEATWVWK